MDETGTSPTGTDQAANAATPAIPRQRDTEAHFATPSWMTPRTDRPETTHSVPAQVVPTHEAVPRPSYADELVLKEGHWTERTATRMIGGALIAVVLIGMGVSLAIAISTRSVISGSIVVACAVVLVVLWSTMLGAGVTTVTLKDGRLKVRQQGELHTFDLADPMRRVELVGSPDDSAWRLLLETPGGGVVELSRAQVNPEELHPVVAHYRAIAQRNREEKDRRFQR